MGSPQRTLYTPELCTPAFMHFCKRCLPASPYCPCVCARARKRQLSPGLCPSSSHDLGPTGHAVCNLEGVVRGDRGEWANGVILESSVPCVSELNQTGSILLYLFVNVSAFFVIHPEKELGDSVTRRAVWFEVTAWKAWTELHSGENSHH